MAGNAAVIANLSVFQATDKVFADTIYQADGVTPQDITGWTLAFVLHAYGDPTCVFLTKPLTITSAAAGQASWTVAAADTAGLWCGTYAWRVEKTDPGADDVVSAGLFSILPK